MNIKVPDFAVIHSFDKVFLISGLRRNELLFPALCNKKSYYWVGTNLCPNKLILVIL